MRVVFDFYQVTYLEFLTGKSNALWVGITWVFQLLGAHIAFLCAQMWWTLRPTAHDAARYELSLDITQLPADLQVSAWIGFLIESLGSFVEFYLAFALTSVIVQRNHYPRGNSGSSAQCIGVPPKDIDREVTTEKLEAHSQSRLQFLASFFIRLCVNLYLTAKCLNLTGMYINPANAFAHCWGTGGVSPYTHIAVYWFGPFFGVWLATQAEGLTVRIIQPFKRHFTAPCNTLAQLSEEKGIMIKTSQKLQPSMSDAAISSSLIRSKDSSVENVNHPSFNEPLPSSVKSRVIGSQTS